MERNEIKSSDHVVYIAASVAILALLAFFAARSVLVLHRFELPALYFQAHLFSHVFVSEDYETESCQIQNIRNALDAEFIKRNNYSSIKAETLRKIVRSSSAHTRNCTRVLVSVFLGSFGLLITGMVVRARNRLYETRENVRSIQQNGVEGFIRLIGQHLDPGTMELVRRSPTPRNLENAFRAAREKVNIPCSVAARLFPRRSKERLALLEYGKAKVRFAEDPQTSLVMSDGGVTA